MDKDLIKNSLRVRTTGGLKTYAISDEDLATWMKKSTAKGCTDPSIGWEIHQGTLQICVAALRPADPEKDWTEEQLERVHTFVALAGGYWLSMEAGGYPSNGSDHGEVVQFGPREDD